MCGIQILPEAPVELGPLIAPRRPAGARLAGEQFQIGTGDQSFDAFVDSVWLARVFPAWRDDALAHIGVQPLGIAACRE